MGITIYVVLQEFCGSFSSFCSALFDNMKWFAPQRIAQKRGDIATIHFSIFYPHRRKTEYPLYR